MVLCEADEDKVTMPSITMISFSQGGETAYATRDQSGRTGGTRPA